MYHYYYNLEKNKGKCFLDFKLIDSMNDEEFKHWFAFNIRDMFRELIVYKKECGAKHLAVLPSFVLKKTFEKNFKK